MLEDRVPRPASGGMSLQGKDEAHSTYQTGSLQETAKNEQGLQHLKMER